MKDKLIIFTAGFAMEIAKNTAKKWNDTHDLKAEVIAGGSVDLANKIVQGETCDIFISADDILIKNMLMPQFCSGYHVFAGNRMAISAMPGRSINSGNWKEKLLAPDAKFFHRNPYGDPGGYRAVMSMMLADHIEPGLSEKLINHPGHLGMKPDHSEKGIPECDYIFTYYTAAVSGSTPYAVLPVEIDLSDESLKNLYATISFTIDKNFTVAGAPISHAFSIPILSCHPMEARSFAKLFLDTDFKSLHFTERKQSFCI